MSAPTSERLAELRRTVHHRRDSGWVGATMTELLDIADALNQAVVDYHAVAHTGGYEECQQNPCAAARVAVSPAGKRADG